MSVDYGQSCSRKGAAVHREEYWYRVLCAEIRRTPSIWIASRVDGMPASSHELRGRGKRGTGGRDGNRQAPGAAESCMIRSLVM